MLAMHPLHLSRELRLFVFPDSRYDAEFAGGFTNPSVADRGQVTPTLKSRVRRRRSLANHSAIFRIRGSKRASPRPALLAMSKQPSK